MIPSPTPMEPPRSEDAAGPRPTLLPWAIRVALVLTAMGFATSHFLSQTLPGSGMASTVREWRVVAGGGDPETTGSLGGDRPSPRDVRLDPCKAGADLRLR